MRTMIELAQEALDIQSAANLSGCVHSFSRAITELRALLQNELGASFSTDQLNTHHICVLYADKIAQLSNSEGSLSYYKAYKWAQDITKGDDK